MGEELGSADVHDLRVLYIARGLLLAVLVNASALLGLWAVDVVLTGNIQLTAGGLAASVGSWSVVRAERRLRASLGR